MWRVNLGGGSAEQGEASGIEDKSRDPSKALSDGPNQIPLHLLEGVLKRLQAIHQAVRSC